MRSKTLWSPGPAYAEITSISHFAHNEAKKMVIRAYDSVYM